MTALAANYDRGSKGNEFQTLDVKAAAHPYNGSIVVTDATGYALVAADTAGMVVQGVATSEQDNSAGSNGDLEVKIQRGKAFPFACSGASQAWVGFNAYVSDDNTVALKASVTNHILVGKIVEYESSTVVWVYIPIMKEFDREDLVENSLQSYSLMTKMVGAGGVPLGAATAGTHNLAVGTNTLTIDAEVANNETETSVSYTLFQLPSEYISGGTVTIAGKIIAQGAGTLGASTIDFSAYESDGEEGVGSDLVTTAAVSLVDDAWTPFAFTVTPTALAAGDTLLIKMTTVVIESATDDMVATIDGLAIKIDVKG